MTTVGDILSNASSGIVPCADEAHLLASCDDLSLLGATAASIRDAAFGDQISFSKKIFLPITQLCRNVCHYCTFAQTPRNLDAPYLSREQVLHSVREAEEAGCKEALFTLGELPELRYPAARNALKSMGFETTLEYVYDLAATIRDETNLVPHINAGCMSYTDAVRLKKVSASMGLMLETTSRAVCEKNGAHFGSPDKDPVRRLESIEIAGKAKIPFTTGILVGIGETRDDRIDSLLAIRELHARYGHIQEVIVQNFKPKPGTKMANAPEPALEDFLWTVAVARILLPSEISLQAPPNLSPDALHRLIACGINDWGGACPR